MVKYIQIGIAIIVIFISIFWIKSLVEKHKIKKQQEELVKQQEELKKQKENSSKSWKWKIEKTVNITFTGEYGEIYRGIGPGTNVSSQNATEPYFVKNKIGEFPIQRPAQKGEDIFLIIGNSTNNNELRFRSSNGKTGSIDIIFWVWVKE